MTHGKGLQHSDGRLAKEARDWLSRERLGTLSPVERAQLAAWRAASQRHEDAYQEAQRLWAMTGAASRAFEVTEPQNLTRRWILRGGFLTAGAAGAAYAGSWVGFFPPWQSFLADYATSRGERRTIDLGENLRVELDGASAINVSDKRERMSVLHGAAAITVVSGVAHPIIVDAGHGFATTQKSVFSVLKGTNSVQIACLDGSVDVTCQGEQRLRQGQAVTYGANGLDKVQRVRVEDMAAWRKGFLIFRNRALQDVVADLNRHRQGRIVITNRALGLRRVSGTFNLDDLDQVLLQLTAAFGLKSTSFPGGITFLS